MVDTMRSVMLVGILALAAGAVAQPPVLEVTSTIDGGDDAMLYRPEALCFGPDGSCYVLNAGDSRVLQFAPDWTLIREFGRDGSGPGEFTAPVGMFVRAGEIWVFEMMRATVFSLAGEYRRTLNSRHEMHDPLSTDRGILVRLGTSDRLAALLDDELTLIEKIGPECPTDVDFMTEYRTCGFVHALPHPDHLALLLNRFDGHLWVLDDEGAVSREIELIGASGQSHTTEPDDDGRVIMQFTLVVAEGGVDHRGNLWVMPMDPEAEEDEPQLIVVRDRGLEPVAEYVLPEGIQAFAVVPAPTGELLLVDSNSSQIHVCAYPEGLPGG
jgi:hypothetical protein